MATVPLMTVDAEQAAEQETEHWRDFQQLMMRTLDITESLVLRAMARDMEDQVEAGRVRAITTEYKTVTR